ncbi:MAG: cytidine deaminase [Alphaproteobacteria bacterium]|nr:cytidine deaminase [Alphaproteobacteria bacterium]
MPLEPVTAADLELIEAARAEIQRLYMEDCHQIGAAVRTRDGRVYAAVHLDAYVRPVSVCAETIAIGKTVSEGERGGAVEIATVVAVRHPKPNETLRDLRVVSPCGSCRELISDYGPEARIIVSDGDRLAKLPIADLLPRKYQRLRT